MHALVKRIQQKDVRALAKAITIVENDQEDKLELLSDIFSVKKHAHYIGITGSPGAGKSSLVNRLIKHVRAQGLTIAIIAVDPTSPFSGGALLGDRVRMNEHFTDDGVYIRSMATRGSLGGLSRATKDAMRVCDAYGFDIVLVETVGVGQSELDIMKVADTTALMLTPNSGDVLQVFKAGIMEIADLFIINKADLPGVNKLTVLLQDYMRIAKGKGYTPTIVKTISTENSGTEELWDNMKAHRAYLYDSEEGREQRKRQLKHEVKELVREEIWREASVFIDNKQGEIGAFQSVDADPYQLASKLFKQWKQEGRT